MKINFVALNPISDDALARHRSYSHGLGLPEVGDRAVSTRLAVVGGGPSVANYLEEIRTFDGEVWAINGAWKWCRDNGIDAAFYTIDPREDVLPLCEGAERAIFSDVVCPKAFERVPDVELAKIGEDEINNWSTSAATAPMIALKRGHRHVVFYGCESSFADKSHIYADLYKDKIWVECGGKEYISNALLVPQAEFMAELARGAPNFMTIKGDGFLPALIEHGDYKITHVCRQTYDRLKEQNNGFVC